MRLRRRRRKEEEGEREKYREGRGGEPPWQPKLHPPLFKVKYYKVIYTI